MQITYSSVRDPKWANPEQSMIVCMVKFDHLKREVEFAANPKDSEGHGREIFADCAAGKHGPVAQFDSDVKRGPALPPAHEPNLQHYEQWPDLLEFLHEANRENSAGTTRGQVLVWSSVIELLLERLIEAFLIDHRIAKELLDGAHMPFSAQIDLAFSLGLISKAEHRICHNIRAIRNQMAHSWTVTLDDPKVKPALRSLYDGDHSTLFEWVENIEFLIKFIYSGSCSMIALRLAERQKAAREAKRVKLDDPTPCTNSLKTIRVQSLGA